LTAALGLTADEFGWRLNPVRCRVDDDFMINDSSTPRRFRGVTRSVLGLALAALVAVTVGTPAEAAPGRAVKPAPVRMAVAAGPTGSVGGLSVGVTHTQYSADKWNPAASRDRAETALRSAAALQNQHIMGFGALSPEPSPGRYDWSTLDARVDLMRRNGGTPVLTLCCSPDWMKGGAAGTTDWSRLAIAPTPDHYDDYARLAATVAKRYPDVKHFMVWNELKGFWDTSRNRWNIEAYTAFYNTVYRALKAVNPAIKVGGPYLVVNSWSNAATMSHPSALRGPWGVVDQRDLDAIGYWLANAAGADFIAVDGGNSTKDKGVITDESTANRKLAVITTWIRQQTTLPVWWAEFYPGMRDPHNWAGSRERSAVAVDALLQVRQAGASVVLLWQPEARPTLTSVALWTDTSTASGGNALPMTYALNWLRPRFAAGQPVTSRWAAPGRVLCLTSGTAKLTVGLLPSATVPSCG
jgi:hypothetical protein